MGYTVCFNRDRDSYMVPLALAEANQLDNLVTDYYHGASPFVSKRLAHRQVDGIGPSSVTTVTSAVVLQAAWSFSQRIGLKTSFPSRYVDLLLAKKTIRVMRRRPSDAMLIYSGYARLPFLTFPEAFKVLFQFHPSPNLIQRTMSADQGFESSPLVQEPELTDPSGAQRRYMAEIGLADRVLCASSFTRRGLLEDGYPDSQIAVIPYGCPPPTRESPPRAGNESSRFLFVGQGVQRKGLHVLLMAWKHMDSRHTLRLVCSRIDPGLAKAAARMSNVQLSPAISRHNLSLEFERADCLVLPSLVEGFGLVLGEALAHGCRLIATDNTGLPDLHLPDDLGGVVQAGDVGSLLQKMESVATASTERAAMTAMCKSAAASRSWLDFRKKVASEVVPETGNY